MTCAWYVVTPCADDISMAVIWMTTIIISGAEGSWFLQEGWWCINGFFHDVYPCETVFIMYMQNMQSKSSSGSTDTMQSECNSIIKGCVWLTYNLGFMSCVYLWQQLLQKVHENRYISEHIADNDTVHILPALNSQYFLLYKT